MHARVLAAQTSGLDSACGFQNACARDPDVTIGGLSLIGVPLTVGFVSKWYLILAAIENGWGAVVGFVLLSSLLSVIYIWRIIEVAYFKPPLKPDVPWSEAPLSMLIPTWVLIAANLYFGINAKFTIGVASKAASILLGGGS